MIPLIDSRPPDGYVVYVNFADMHTQGLVSESHVATAAWAAVALFEKLKVVHMTTWRPWHLRPGQYAEVVVCPHLNYVPQPVGGYAFRSCDRTPDWYTPALAYAINCEPHLLGVRIAHEAMHLILPSCPLTPGGPLPPPPHTTIPGNLMNDVSLTAQSTGVETWQADLVAQNLWRVNDGGRLLVAPADPNRVAPDSGVPTS